MTETTTTRPNKSKTASKPDVVFADILCAVDGTRGSFAAVRQAAVLAGPNGHLTLLAVTAVAGAGAYKYAAIGPARAERILDRAAGMAHDAGVRSTKAVDPGSPASQVILDRASQHDLLAIGAPVTSWLGGMFIGGVAVTALGSFTTPLLAARSIRRERHFGHRILVASDGLDGSDHVIELAGRLARSLNAKVILLHAIGVESRARPLRIQEQAHRLKVAVDDAIETQVEAGNAREVIVDTARSTKTSLVVMGSRRLNGLHAIGSVSRRVVHEAHCSVLLVPPKRLRD